LFEKLPGTTLAGKSSSFLIGASVASWLISKEIYIVDAEFFEMICLFGAYYVWYSSGKGAAAQYFKEKQDVFIIVNFSPSKEFWKKLVRITRQLYKNELIIFLKCLILLK
jgi:hypothetical protein